MAIHETAIVAPGAEVGSGVEIGPYCVIGPSVKIGDRTVLGPHVVLEPGTVIGRDCRIMAHASLGGLPQDGKFKGEPSFLRIGDRNIIRESVVIHRATGEGNATEIGSDNMIMAYAHIGHNSVVGDCTTIAGYVGLSGHVVVEDKVVFGGFVGVHQFVRIGKMAMVGGMSRVVQDVPPFMLMQGEPLRPYGLNVVGLRRTGVTTEVRLQLKQAYRLLYRSGMNLQQALESVETQVPPSPELAYLLQFLQSIQTGRHGRQFDRPHK